MKITITTDDGEIIEIMEHVEQDMQTLAGFKILCLEIDQAVKRGIQYEKENKP